MADASEPAVLPRPDRKAKNKKQKAKRNKQKAKSTKHKAQNKNKKQKCKQKAKRKKQKRQGFSEAEVEHMLRLKSALSRRNPFGGLFEGIATRHKINVR